jgi:hypothetical protein
MSYGHHLDFNKINHAIEASKHVDTWRIHVWRCSANGWLSQTLMKRVTANGLSSADFIPVSPDKRTYIGKTWLQENSHSLSEDISETKERVKLPKHISTDMDTKMLEAIGALNKFSASVRRVAQIQALPSMRKTAKN